MSQLPVITYACPEHICWVKEQDHILIVNELSGNSFTLRGKEMVIWSWLTFSLAYGRLEEMAAILLQVEPAAVATWLRARLDTWQKAGLLELYRETESG